MCKKILGVLALLPLILMSIAVIVLVDLTDMHGVNIPSAYWLHIATTILGVILTFVAMIFFLRHVCNNPAFSTGERVLWGILFLFLNVLIYPVYWYKYTYGEKNIETIDLSDSRFAEEEEELDHIREYEAVRSSRSYYYERPKAFAGELSAGEKKKTFDRNWLTALTVVSTELLVIYVIGLIVCLNVMEVESFFSILFLVEVIIGALLAWFGVVSVATVVFIIDVSEQKKISSTMSVIWSVLFTVIGFLVFPVYWFLHVRGTSERGNYEI